MGYVGCSPAAGRAREYANRAFRMGRGRVGSEAGRACEQQPAVRAEGDGLAQPLRFQGRHFARYFGVVGRARDCGAGAPAGRGGGLGEYRHRAFRSSVKRRAKRDNARVRAKRDGMSVFRDRVLGGRRQSAVRDRLQFCGVGRVERGASPAGLRLQEDVRAAVAASHAGRARQYRAAVRRYRHGGSKALILPGRPGELGVAGGYGGASPAAAGLGEDVHRAGGRTLSARADCDYAAVGRDGDRRAEAVVVGSVRSLRELGGGGRGEVHRVGRSAEHVCRAGG